MTRPTAHAEDCPWPDGPHDCTCHLACKQRIFDLERQLAELTKAALDDEQAHIAVRDEWREEKKRLKQRVAGMPEVGEPRRDGRYLIWETADRKDAVALDTTPGIEAPIDDGASLAPAEARLHAAMLLAAANEAEG